MNKVFIAFTSLFLFTACSEKAEKETEQKIEVTTSDNELDDLSIEAIIDSVYQKNGSGLIDKSNISFDFREFQYAYMQGVDGVKQSRKLTNDGGEAVVDSWQGDSLIRTINGKVVKLSKKDENAFRNSINSVFYFAFLPKALKDPAVITELLDEVEINDKMYYKLKVTFNEDGGGEDFHDIFLYWIGIEDYAMDYMAYQYFTNDGGIRFRAVDQVKEVNGILFKDYLNYAPKENLMNDYLSVDEVFSNDGMKLVSEIRLENIEVN
ncbi:hypothetical protein ERX46_16490 [Brumimicrobium glaciale]|uniref:Deoxyribose-phosphate aldolase n=1 Tax=Brumimicrobium glaciale TaxID=200475 RepID=A0A4Q4KEK9_9FLAO|nr:DUF6503 family protein [Brumimicrobium glaciale]RYM31503.1 hypothetical protein ERX46_16490 [Brumimicrobium glaciale]